MKIVQPDGTEWAAILMAEPSKKLVLDDSLELKHKGTMLFHVSCEHVPEAGDMLHWQDSQFYILARYDAGGNHILFVR